MRRTILTALAVVTLILAVGAAAVVATTESDRGDEGGADPDIAQSPAPGADQDSGQSGGSLTACPVTDPQPGAIAPPSPYPERRADDLVWYGSADLWTALPADGAYNPRKSVWWSQSFPGGRDES